MNPNKFTPELFIGVGEKICFFTLRETYLHAVPGPGALGNAVVNGQYQGTYEVRSCHIKNLSQDPDEAYQKACEAAEASGMRLTTSRDDLASEMNRIRRASAEELERRAREIEALRAEWEAEREAEDAQKRATILDGRFAFGPYAGKIFPEAPRGYLTWLMDRVADFDEGSLMRLTAEQVALRVPHMALPKADPELFVGEPKERREFDVTVVGSYSFTRESWSGYGAEVVYITRMVERNTRACLVVMSSAFRLHEGDEVRIKGTIKKHDTYRGQAETFLQRVAIVEEN